MEFSDLKNKNTKELTELQAQKRAELQNLRFRLKSGEEKQNNRASILKKTLARIAMVLRAKALNKDAK